MSENTYNAVSNRTLSTLISTDSAGVSECFGDRRQINSTLSRDSTDYVRKFGDFEDTEDWIECESSTFPGKTYFYNLRSLNSTWVRPISESIRLRRYSQTSTVFHNRCSSMFMLDDKEDLSDSQSRLTAYDTKNYRPEMILMQLYLGMDMDQLARDQDDEHFNYSSEDIFQDEKQRFYEEQGISETIELSPFNIATFPLTNDNTTNDGENFFLPTVCSSENLPSPFFATDVLEMKLLETENTSELAKEGVSIAENSVAHCSFSFCESDEVEINRNYTVPRLQNMKAANLIENIRKTRRSNHKEVKPTSSRVKKPKKRVCEMYGTKTTNFDFVEPELPSWVTYTYLSDSSVATSVSERNDLNFSELNFKDSRLSSDSSTSTNSSSCTSCSTCNSSSSSTNSVSSDSTSSSSSNCTNSSSSVSTNSSSSVSTNSSSSVSTNSQSAR